MPGTVRLRKGGTALCGTALILLLAASHSAHAASLTAITVFGCDEHGTVNTASRSNTGPVDAAWDTFIYEGDVFSKAPGDSGGIPWLNSSADHTIGVPLTLGAHTFTFHIEGPGPEDWVGLNLFFNDRNGQPGISAMVPGGTGGPPYPEFRPNRAKRTMGWPITDVPANGALNWPEVETGLCAFAEGATRKTVVLKHFHFSSPSDDAAIDLVGPHAIGPSGTPDCVGQFVIEVEESVPRPSDLFLWLQTRAGTTMGAPDMMESWSRLFDRADAAPPFSFKYDGKPSSEFLKDWKVARSDKGIDENRTAHIVTYTDSETGLEVRWEGIEHAEYKTIEWTVYLKNTGTENTPIISDIQALDVQLQRSTDCEFALHYNRGDSCDAGSFEPLVEELGAGEAFQSAPSGGRPTNAAFPYFNLRAGSEGVIVVVGWPGQWAAKFARDDDRSIHIVAGQELTRFTLYPSEEVRTPLIVLQFSEEANWIDAQNRWRQWMIKHNIPRPGGKALPLPMFNACSSHQFAEMTKANEESQIAFIDSYLDKGLKLDYWWMDAGWYVGAAENNWTWTGTWEVDRRPHRFPNGLRAVSDHAHGKGVKVIVWFEPERVAGGTWLAAEHPEWVLGGTDGGLLNLGNPEAWDWLVNHIDKIITDEGIDLYRQDFNIDPLGHWRGNDAEDRQGITENKHVAGYLAYWDELLRRHPGMLIDSCASGGRRNDLETMRRAVPLLRSDYLFEPAGQQNHSYGLSFWLPFHGTGYTPSNAAGWGWGTGKLSYDPYTRRSNMCPSNIGCFDFRVEVDDALIRKLYLEWLEIGPNYFGDYYPLTDWSQEQNVWVAMQFNRADAGAGHVQAFRRNDCFYEAARLKLQRLDADSNYVVKDFDAQDTRIVSGSELMEKGLLVAIPGQPGAATVAYTKDLH